MHRFLNLLIIFLCAFSRTYGQNNSFSLSQPDTLTFQSGSLLLKGVLWKPKGTGPFPVVMYNHGSAPSSEAYDAELAPVFLQKGYAFFLPSRRGQNLSKGVGQPIHERLDSAMKAGGIEARSALVIRLHDTEQLQDQLAGLSALKKQPGIDTTRIAVAGSSFGGIQTVLMATQPVGIRAAVNFAGAAMNWERSEAIREWMKAKVAQAKVPIFFVQAKNDYSIGPSQELSARMQQLGLPYRVKIYPPFNQARGLGAGHALGPSGADIWQEEVFAFLDQYLKPATRQKEKPMKTSAKQ